MNTPKQKKRANPDALSELRAEGPLLHYRPIPDEAAAYLGHIVAAYTDLERRMIDIFRVILRIESGEAATLAYSAIKAPSARWDMVRRVLENDHHHIATSADYDRVINEFDRITKIRNSFVHGSWSHDGKGGLWLSPTHSTVVEFLKPRRVKKSEFSNFLDDVEKLGAHILDVAEKERRLLDQRWLERSSQSYDNSSSGHQNGS